MSRGPGKIDRALAAIFADEPEGAFTVEDLCERVYHGINRVERKHRSSLLRALHRLAAGDLGPRLLESGVRGRTLIAFNPENARSTAMAYLKGQDSNFYRYKFRRYGRTRKPISSPEEQEAELKSRLEPDGDMHSQILPGSCFTHWSSARDEQRRREHIRAGRDPEHEQKKAEGEAEAAKNDPGFAAFVRTIDALVSMGSESEPWFDGSATLVPKGGRTRRRFRPKQAFAAISPSKAP